MKLRNVVNLPHTGQNVYSLDSDFLHTIVHGFVLRLFLSDFLHTMGHGFVLRSFLNSLKFWSIRLQSRVRGLVTRYRTRHWVFKVLSQGRGRVYLSPFRKGVWLVSMKEPFLQTSRKVETDEDWTPNSMWRSKESVWGSTVEGSYRKTPWKWSVVGRVWAGGR